MVVKIGNEERDEVGCVVVRAAWGTSSMDARAPISPGPLEHYRQVLRTSGREPILCWWGAGTYEPLGPARRFTARQHSSERRANARGAQNDPPDSPRHPWNLLCTLLEPLAGRVDAAGDRTRPIGASSGRGIEPTCARPGEGPPSVHPAHTEPLKSPEEIHKSWLHRRTARIGCWAAEDPGHGTWTQEKDISRICSSADAVLLRHGLTAASASSFKSKTRSTTRQLELNSPLCRRSKNSFWVLGATLLSRGVGVGRRAAGAGRKEIRATRKCEYDMMHY
ncbi:hypothetical protein G7046_g8014 [Stylonectria norvegica]|nr:hypothetical protein G7046_g8014 [Stylonectria norvegica]